MTREDQHKRSLEIAAAQRMVLRRALNVIEEGLKVRDPFAIPSGVFSGATGTEMDELMARLRNVRDTYQATAHYAGYSGA